MRFVGEEMRRIVKTLPFLVKDSADFLRQLKGVSTPVDAKTVKFDTKDFFMSGRHDQLISRCSRQVAPELQQSFAEVLDAILSKQLVQQSSGAITLFRMKSGSGLEISCSPEISNVCFGDMVEKDYVALLEARGRYKTYFYCRFMDDGILIIGGNRLRQRDVL